ncbi:hypothetical protein LDENG_00001230 [Lucifuga dentata]|nr:hypothetical protein LDENG_00001230 [Lucifuga dentata]
MLNSVEGSEMSFCHGSKPQEGRPGTARVPVTELSGSGPINPTPTMKRCVSPFPFLCPETLEMLCGTQDLSQVTSLELCVDTREQILGNFGVYLPNLVHLKLNNSMMSSVKDVGTALSHLQVLWMSRCCLQELDGILLCSSLKELYVAYNNVSDLSQLGMLENLQILDLEGNNVDDLIQVKYLGLCSKLQTLNLEGNPVCVRPNRTAAEMAQYSYRAAVRELIPQLRYLDNVKAEEDGPSCSSTMGEEWAMVIDSIRDNSHNHNEEAADTCPYNRPNSPRRPASSLSCGFPFSSMVSRPLSGFRPMSATRHGLFSPPGSRPGSADSDRAAVDVDTSTLTHGAGKNLFYGNPIKAIRARREKLKTAPTASTFTPPYLPIHVPEHTYDLEEPDVGERSDVFAELKAWREQYSRHLQIIEREKLPQVLVIQHNNEEKEEHDDDYGKGDDDNDDDDDDDDDDEVDLDIMKSESSDEERGEEKHSDDLEDASPDSSFQSLSPDLPQRDALSPDVARLSLSPDTTPSPCPPLNATGATGYRRPLGIRARRLQLSQVNAEPSCVSTLIERPLVVATTRADTNTVRKVHQVTRPKIPLWPQPTLHSTSTLGEGLIDLCAGNLSRNKCQTSKLQERPSITRPHTARAALQKHHHHHML